MEDIIRDIMTTDENKDGYISEAEWLNAAKTNNTVKVRFHSLFLHLSFCASTFFLLFLLFLLLVFFAVLLMLFSRH